MPEVIVKYKKPETLKILKSLAKYFDFTVSHRKKTEDSFEDKFKDILIPGDPSIDTAALTEIFSGRNIDAKQLRKDAWERKR